MFCVLKTGKRRSGPSIWPILVSRGEEVEKEREEEEEEGEEEAVEGSGETRICTER